MQYLISSEIFQHVSRILLIGGSIVATVGACRIYYKWQAGQGNIETEIATWAFGVVFLLVASLSVKAIFGY